MFLTFTIARLCIYRITTLEHHQKAPENFLIYKTWILQLKGSTYFNPSQKFLYLEKTFKTYFEFNQVNEYSCFMFTHVVSNLLFLIFKSSFKTQNYQ